MGEHHSYKSKGKHTMFLHTWYCVLLTISFGIFSPYLCQWNEPKSKRSRAFMHRSSLESRLCAFMRGRGYYIALKLPWKLREAKCEVQDVCGSQWDIDMSNQLCYTFRLMRAINRHQSDTYTSLENHIQRGLPVSQDKQSCKLLLQGDEYLQAPYGN